MNVPINGAYGRRATKLVEENPRIFLTQWSSRFPEAILERPDARILHVIRDPRDVLLSGARYHCIAPEAGEEFLHEPRSDLGGKTYQEHLKTLPFHDQLRFEMHEKHATTLRQMLGWDYSAKNRIELRYEDLMRDRHGWRFFSALRTLGLSRIEAMRGRRIFLRRSLFGGLSEEDKRPDRIKLHIADGSVAQWRSKMPRAIAEEYAKAFGAALVVLGYEKHPTAWLDQIDMVA